MSVEGEPKKLEANPKDLKVSNVYKIIYPPGYGKLNLVYAQKIGDAVFSFLGAVDDAEVPQPLFVTHQSGNTYNVDDHRQPSKFPPEGDAITIEHQPVASAEQQTREDIYNEAKGSRRRRNRRGKGKTRKRKRKRTKKKRRRKRKRTKKKRRRRRRR